MKITQVNNDMVLSLIDVRKKIGEHYYVPLKREAVKFCIPYVVSKVDLCNGLSKFHHNFAFDILTDEKLPS